MAPALLPSVPSLLIKVYVEQQAAERRGLLFNSRVALTPELIQCKKLSVCLNPSPQTHKGHSGISAQRGLTPGKSCPLAF